MGSEWEELTLGNLCDLITDGKHGDCRDEGNSGFYFLSVKDVVDNRLVYENARQITEQDFLETHRRTNLEPGDVLFTNTGTIGRMAIAPDDPKTYRTTFQKSVAILKPVRDRIDPRFLYYSLQFENARLSELAEGTTQKNLLLRDLRNFSIHVPPMPLQRRIAYILGTLDDKIELNRRMNETLEAIARALFKSWFVDFDPVRAKAEGRDTGLSTHIAELFPDSFEDSELGEIPSGWEMVSLGDVTEFAYGKALKEHDRRPGPVGVYGSNGLIGWHDERLVSGPGIVVGRKGNPGIVTWVQTDFFPIDTTFYVIPRHEYFDIHFLYFALREQELASLGADSAVPGLNRNLAYMNSQLLPPPPLIRAFAEFARPLFERRRGGNDEQRTVEELRHALLPKLISGEVRVANFGRLEVESGT